MLPRSVQLHRQPYPVLSSPVQNSEYDDFRTLLIEARVKSGISQRELCKRLSKPPTYVTKIESGVRRIDTVETIAFLREVGADPLKFFSTLLED
ncbi:MAG: helix-turn-helix domain-containing protein [Armatimonadetes bacterium]|nr:helix-turn-helix domain-containing protein [Armatimonadota bacterium]